MSLGFVSYGILGWRLPYVHGQTYIRMADGIGLQWFFGHDVKMAHEFKGVTAEQVVCKPQHHPICYVCLWLCVGACVQQTCLPIKTATTATDLRPALMPDTMSGQGLVWRIGAEEELIRFAFLNKVPFTGQQLALMAKSMGISLRLISKTGSVDNAVNLAKAIASKRLPELETTARLSLVRAIVEPMVTCNLDDPVLALVLDDMSRDHPSYKDFHKLHEMVKGNRAAPAKDEHADGRAGRAVGPTTQVTDLAYRAAPSTYQLLYWSAMCCGHVF